MANNILSTLLGKEPFALYNMSTKTTTPFGVKITKLVANFHAEPQRQMLEDGSTITDSKTVKGGKLALDVICPDVNVLMQVNAVLADRTSLYQITSRGLIFANYMIDEEFIKQTPEVLSATPMRISFKQILIENESPVIFANKADASLIERGIAAISSVKDTAADLFEKASSAVSKVL